VLGNFGTLFDLGAIALGALVFSFVYWGFGFLRMGTTGFVAQASGAGDEAEVRSALWRSLLIAGFIGIVLILLQYPIRIFAFELLQASRQTESIAGEYFKIRIWGAPATLGMFALVGVLIGLGESKKLLIVQLFLNILNIVLDVLFAGILGLGAEGVALGTLIAEWFAFVFAGWMIFNILKSRFTDSEKFLSVERVLNRSKLLTTLSANTDIMIRTLLLVFAFAWFTNQSAQFGDVILAANYILLQLISFSAFFLDGFAFVAESFVGLAIGSRNRLAFDLAVRKTSELALVTAVFLTILLLLFGSLGISLLTDISDVNQSASTLLYLAAIYVLLSFPAFQLDGIFIGATHTAQMRNASMVAILVFLACWWPLTARFGVEGLWYSFIIYVCARAASLLYYFKSLRRTIVAA
jgi:MATE family multidrug resistance protein